MTASTETIPNSSRLLSIHPNGINVSAPDGSKQRATDSAPCDGLEITAISPAVGSRTSRRRRRPGKVCRVALACEEECSAGLAGEREGGGGGGGPGGGGGVSRGTGETAGGGGGGGGGGAE